jgi:hypothetical protein
MKKIWHPYTAWEDWQNGMWRIAKPGTRTRLLRKAIEFTGNAKLYGSFMRRVIHEWPIACEHHLTDQNINRKAWIGHAATCLAIQCPEDITRQAWGYLSKQQQDDANLEAELAIEEWERQHEAKNSKLYSQVEKAGLPA